ncbi:MAG: segregation/condensation protein A [Peptococcaceae bacterium]|nr:segregation/condensation protein A [Peptococcaceae bacterium]
MAYQLNLGMFEGPFDLLLHLIEKNEVNIYDIPIAEITRQYLEYLTAMQELDLEIASEFLVMAANLLSIKAKMLLPKLPKEGEDEESLDARSQLVQDLLEYKHFKEMAGLLEARGQAQNLLYPRGDMEEVYLSLFAPENPLDGKKLEDLTQAFANICKRLSEIPPVHTIIKEQVTIGDKVQQIKAALIAKPEGVTFTSFICAECSKLEVIVLFLAVLELLKCREIDVQQSGNYEEIYIYARDGEEAIN